MLLTGTVAASGRRWRVSVSAVVPLDREKWSTKCAVATVATAPFHIQIVKKTDRFSNDLFKMLFMLFLIFFNRLDGVFTKKKIRDSALVRQGKGRCFALDHSNKHAGERDSQFLDYDHPVTFLGLL